MYTLVNLHIFKPRNRNENAAGLCVGKCSLPCLDMKLSQHSLPQEHRSMVWHKGVPQGLKGDVQASGEWSAPVPSCQAQCVCTGFCVLILLTTDIQIHGSIPNYVRLPDSNSQFIWCSDAFMAVFSKGQVYSRFDTFWHFSFHFAHLMSLVHLTTHSHFHPLHLFRQSRAEMTLRLNTLSHMTSFPGEYEAWSWSVCKLKGQPHFWRLGCAQC